MKNLLDKFQKNMMAATFAEAGEWDTAREIAPDTELSREPSWLDKIFTAVTFAESGLHNEAIRLMKPAVAKRRVRTTNLADELGLNGVRLVYGTVSIY